MTVSHTQQCPGPGSTSAIRTVLISPSGFTATGSYYNLLCMFHILGIYVRKCKLQTGINKKDFVIKMGV